MAYVAALVNSTPTIQAATASLQCLSNGSLSSLHMHKSQGHATHTIKQTTGHYLHNSTEAPAKLYVSTD